MCTQSQDWVDGYRDGLRYHMELELDIKDKYRYCHNDDYQRGFDQAGEDS